MLNQNKLFFLPYRLRRIVSRLFFLPAILFTMSPGVTYAQETFIQPPARLITTFPIILFTGGVMIVRARLGDFPDSLNFVLDTGSGGISLDSTTCVRLKLHPELSDKTILGIAGIREVKFLYNQTLHLPGLRVDSLNFHVSDYDILTSVYGEKIDGIIGYSFLSRYIIEINYDSLRVSVYSQGSFRYPRSAYQLRPVIPSLPIIYAETEDARKVFARYFFDTGAGLCALFSNDYISDSSLLNRKKKFYLTQAQGLGGKATMRLTVMDELKVGPFRFHKVPVYLFDDLYNVTSYPNLCGLIGNDILRRFNVILNYDRRVFCLTPNSHYRDQFDYSYTGMSIYKEESDIRIGDIMEGSPAEKAGLKVDDVIVAVNNSFNNNIQAYKNLLQNAGDKLKVIVSRNGQLMTFKLLVKSIR
jgi:PDZ domain/Aspartyl protease